MPSDTKLILALDVSNKDEIKSLIKELKPHVDIFKVGSQVYTAFGPGVVEWIRQEGKDVFLDLKFHDIPNTVALAAYEAVKMGVHMFDVHASGGAKMMKEVMCVVSEGAKAGHKKPLVFGITVLTSFGEDDLNEIGVDRKVADQVLHLALLAKSLGLDGVVASGHEIKSIKETCGKDFKLVIPGIRPGSAVKGDQKRVMTPREAKDAGADFIVVGRPVLEAKDRAAVAAHIREELRS